MVAVIYWPRADFSPQSRRYWSKRASFRRALSSYLALCVARTKWFAQALHISQLWITSFVRQKSHNLLVKAIRNCHSFSDIDYQLLATGIALFDEFYTFGFTLCSRLGREPLVSFSIRFVQFFYAKDKWAKVAGWCLIFANPSPHRGWLAQYCNSNGVENRSCV